MAEVGCLKDGHFQNLLVEARTSLSGGHLNTVVLSGGGTTVLTAANSGATCVFDSDAASNFTLPAPELGMRFTFITVAPNTATVADHVIQAATNDQGFLGGVISASTTASKADTFAADADGSNDFITLNKTDSGGDPGTRIEVVALADASAPVTPWGVSGQIACDISGATVTPFGDSQL